MKSYYGLLVALALAVLFGAVQCSKCASEPGGAADSDLPGEALNDASILADSARLEWEQVPLGTPTKDFKTAIAGVLQQELSSIEEVMQCGAMQGTWVISPVKKAIIEHVSKGELTFCYLASHNLKTSSRVSSVRGEFLADRLVQLHFRFKKESYDALVAELTSRFGEGEQRALQEMALVKAEVQSFLLWKVKDTIWGLKNGDQDITLYIQDVASLGQLPVAAGNTDTAPPKKTDLSDIGISGSPYDVNLDDLDDVDAPVPAKDAAIDSDAAASAETEASGTDS